MDSGTDTHTIPYLRINSFVRERLSECISERGKTQRPIRYTTTSSDTPALSLFNTEQRIGLRWRFPTTMLSFSWINLPNISISGLITPHSENIVQILVATFTLLALLPHSFYFQSILRHRLNLSLSDSQVDDFPFSILSIIWLFTI